MDVSASVQPARDADGRPLAVRVEWARARARKVRWTEEVLLLREEMRRVMRYLAWQSEWWRQRLEPRVDLDREISAGIQAYALKQADWHTRLAGFFRGKWDTSVVTSAREAGDAGGSGDEEPRLNDL
jgi:hypothetical protein